MAEFFKKIGRGIVAHKVLTIIIVAVVVLSVTFSCLGALVFNRFSSGIVPTDNDIKALKESGGVYSRVVIFGVDGAGGYFGEMDTPNFDKVFKDGSITYTALSQFPTISAQNWGSMIHGVRCSKHKLTNDKASNQNYSDTKYPSFFKVYSERHDDAVMVSIVDWTAINKGIIEHDLKGMKMINAGDHYEGDEGEIGVDKEVAAQAVAYIQDKDPDILFMHFDSVDGAGHSSYYGSPEFIKAMNAIDGCIGTVYDAYCEKGWQNDTLFICIADHGHEKVGGGHGSNNASVRYVTCAVAGGLGNVIKGTPGKVVTQDIAAIVTYALGDKLYDTWDCSVPKNMFKNLDRK